MYHSGSLSSGALNRSMKASTRLRTKSTQKLLLYFTTYGFAVPHLQLSDLPKRLYLLSAIWS